ncbi:MAG: hypothetical protein KJ646_04760 [Nanoarchaeota archaeon]|nr:hypothetical protein [Nanoarchaeota archaeon]MBU4116756.1 hypothetical protein [Nanoarchaeota archaeon]
MTKIVNLTDKSNLVTNSVYDLKGNNKQVEVIFTDYDEVNLEFLETSAQGFIKYLIKKDSIKMTTSRIGVGWKYLEVSNDLKGQEIPKGLMEYSKLSKKLEGQ